MPDEILATFKFCKKCQCDTDHYKSGHCKPCTKARVTAKKAENPGKVKEYLKAYREANKEKCAKNEKTWRKNNRERVKEFQSAWIQSNLEKVHAAKTKWSRNNTEAIRDKNAKWDKNNPEKRKAYSKKDREKHKEAHKQRLKAWQKANPEALKINRQNRRALKIANGGKLSRGLEKRLFKLQKGKCTCCGLPLGDDYHLDHIMPLSLGGANTDDNVQLLRSLCNLQKHAKHPIDFMQERGFLL